MSRDDSKAKLLAFVAVLTIAFCAVLALLVHQLKAQGGAGASSDEAALKQIVAAFSDGWNRHDAHSMCAALAEDGDFISWRGEENHGRKAFEDYHASLFAGLYKNTRRTDEVKRIRF